MKLRLFAAAGLVPLLSVCTLFAQQVNFAPNTLDPTRNISNPQMIDQGAPALPEEYIWTAGNASSSTAQRMFRAEFSVAKVLQNETFYLVGPESAEIYINGKHVRSIQSDPAIPLKMSVFTVGVAQYLKPGKNVLALKVTPRRNEQFLAAKIVPAAPGVYAPALMISNGQWKSAENAADGWQSARFDDSGWKPVHSFGAVESSIEFFQWNDDAGMYAWPGYIGSSKFLAHVSIPAHAVEQTFFGNSQFENVDALTTPDSGKEFTVKKNPSQHLNPDTPSLLLDFGKEITGRIELVSDAKIPIHVTVAYGESKDEALIQPYLGADPIAIPPHGTAYGPKSSFRYAKIRFLGDNGDLTFKKIALDAIYYPVKYQGSFESSDPLLNRIWEVGAYTSHLCMQDDIWDAPKRDRGRWAGDLDVSGRAIDDIFLDKFLMQDTMTRLVGDTPVHSHVNDIPGYSAWWISELTQYYLHTGSQEYLKSLHPQLVQLLAYMDSEFDSKNLFANNNKAWPFVDWSPDLDGNTPEAQRATQFEFYLAYQDAAYLLRQLGDSANADKYTQRAQQLKEASQKNLLDPSTGTFGSRWQTNAIAVYSGVADESQYAPIWDHVLSSVDKTTYTAFIMSPYYNYYIISAMAQTGHTEDALNWIRAYWGGMLAEGATSTWEAYYPSWPKSNFHASLQADGGTGYFVSLAHGWSSGPTAFAMERILGIQPTAPGFAQVTIRPDLGGLQWAKGAEPTPHGLLKVDVQQNGTTIALPPDVAATVSVPVNAGQHVVVNGKEISNAKPVENGARAEVILKGTGQYVLTAK